MFDPNTPFKLPPLPPEIDYSDRELTNLLMDARIQIAELKGYSVSLPNPLLLMSPWILKEAVASSNIENINTTVVQALQMQLFPEREQREPEKEVLRYRDAIAWGYKTMNEIPISSRFIKGIHKRLMPSVRGYRTTQNKIENSLTGETIYTPPIAQDIHPLIASLETFIHDEATGLDPLIKCALTHYQFEAIHPFGDGNGRTGRILIVLQMIHENLLNYPTMFISGYINKNRNEYYRLLREITMNGEWMDYLKYMLKGFHTQAKETITTFLEIMNFREEFKAKLKKDAPNIYSSDLVDSVFSFPIVTPTSLSDIMDKHRTTSTRYLKTLNNLGLLEYQEFGKYHLYINQHLLDILQKD